MSASAHNPLVSVIIPVFNEEASLPQVIADLPRDILHDIIVVDNASTDGSATLAADLGCRVVREDRRGYGQACLAGIAALDTGTDIVVFVDGDYSDHPDQLPRLIQPILSGEYEFVIGSRAAGNREPGAMTPQAYYGNKLACFLMKLFWGVRYSDLGPFRAITRRALEQLCMSDRDFGWTIEMQIRAAEEGIATTEIPVDYRRRTGVSKISGTVKGTILASHKILHTIFMYKFFRNAGRRPVTSVADKAC